MKICVAGLWHLGSVTAACLAEKGFEVVGYDSDIKRIAALQENRAPLFEPGLDALIAQQSSAGRLNFTSSIPAALRDVQLLWITYDTPVDENDQADLGWLKERVNSLMGHVVDGQAVLISSQAPVGFCAELESDLKRLKPGLRISVACSPENLRLGKAIEVFQSPDRIVIGVRRPEDQAIYEPILSQISKNIVWMKTESAEMTKHAINSFLATSVVFANELAVLCEEVGADAQEVERGLKSESRIGPKAYLKAGAAFAGGTLARDVRFLSGISKRMNAPSFLLNAILESNAHHQEWAQRKLAERFENLSGTRIALLGLTYKAGTDTLRRSWGVTLSEWLHNAGASVIAFDWQITELPSELAGRIDLKSTPAAALERCDSVVVCTDHPKLKEISVDDLRRLKRPFIIDPNGTLRSLLPKDLSPLEYCAVGITIERG